jgi:hypothetical protein
MALTLTELDRIEEFLMAHSAAENLLTFRVRFPGVSLTRCEAGDMSGDASPYKVHAEFELFLVDGRDHCWQLTQDPARATGVVLAMRRASRI